MPFENLALLTVDKSRDVNAGNLKLNSLTMDWKKFMTPILFNIKSVLVDEQGPLGL